MGTIKVKTADLIGPALDWAVAHAVKAWETAHELFPTMTLDPTFSGVEARPYPRGEYGTMLLTCVLVPRNPFRQDPQSFCPSTDWSQGGPLIEKYRIELRESGKANWWADKSMLREGVPDQNDWCGHGPSALIAACRAIVAAKLGDSVDVPEELVKP